jgi:chromosome segregation ATPase
VSDRSIDPETEKSLRIIADKQTEVGDLNQKIAMLDKEQTDIFKDQERVRGNLQRLGQTPDEATLRLRYIRQLDSQENRLAATKTDREKLQASHAAAQKQLEALIQKLALDKKL